MSTSPVNVKGDSSATTAAEASGMVTVSPVNTPDPVKNAVSKWVPPTVAEPSPLLKEKLTPVLSAAPTPHGANQAHARLDRSNPSSGSAPVSDKPSLPSTENRTPASRGDRKKLLTSKVPLTSVMGSADAVGASVSISKTAAARFFQIGIGGSSFCALRCPDCASDFHFPDPCDVQPRSCKPEAWR